MILLILLPIAFSLYLSRTARNTIKASLYFLTISALTIISIVFYSASYYKYMALCIGLSTIVAIAQSLEERIKC